MYESTTYDTVAKNRFEYHVTSVSSYAAHTPRQMKSELLTQHSVSDAVPHRYSCRVHRIGASELDPDDVSKKSAVT
jgi:hypothetical protein